MRRRMGVVSTGTAWLALIGLLLAFGCERAAPAPVDQAAAQAATPQAQSPAAPVPASQEPPASGTVEDGVRVVRVTARQFEFDPARIVVKQGEQVQLKVTSQDVAHSLSLAGYDVDLAVLPQRTETVKFVANKAGTFEFRCAVYCGEGHKQMRGDLLVLPRSR